MPLRPARRKIKNSVVVGEDTTGLAVYDSNLPAERPSQDVEDLKYLMDTAVTPDDWTAIFIKAKDMSIEGNIKAMEFLARYRWGMPATMTADVGEKRQHITIVEVIKASREKETLEVKSLPADASNDTQSVDSLTGRELLHPELQSEPQLQEADAPF